MSPVTPAEAVDAAQGAFGRHPGFRALHAKGILLRGTFTARPGASRYSRAVHFAGEPVPATCRFSNGSGNPDSPDYAPDVRGLAVKLYLPDGSKTDIVAQSAPHFPVSTPEGFVELLRARQRGPAMAWRLPLFLARHPRAAVRLPSDLRALKPAVSYATVNYYGLHAFRLLDADGGSRYARYLLAPEAGDRRLSVREARTRGRDYLQQEIVERAGAGPVRFTLELQIAAPGDTVDDPSDAWPADRERFAAGTLEIQGPETEREQGGDVLVFDPTRVVDGIELSDDPILQFRSRAYSESVARRMKG